MSYEPTVAEGVKPSLDDASLYINRELSALEFQRRVLEQAQDESCPLLERVKFLGILGSNLDEFFMVRVAGLQQQIAAGVVEPTPDGMTPAETLAEARRRAAELTRAGLRTWREALVPQLDEAGIHIVSYTDLTRDQAKWATRYFNEMLFPVLTPLAFDPGRPFPHISNLSLNLAALIRGGGGELRFARIKVPGTLPRLVPLRRSSGGLRRDGTVPHHHYFIYLEELIAKHLDSLFPGMDVIESYPFRVTRDADMTLQEMEAADLLETIEESVRRRRFGGVVRLEIDRSMPDTVTALLVEELEVSSSDVLVLDEPLGLGSLSSLYAIERHDLKYAPFLPAIPERLTNLARPEAIFDVIRNGDVLLHHPFDSFSPVIDLLQAAARDPDVLAIKQTLYRVGRNSPVVDALLEARENGKQVAVLVELKARFDEESNISWARTLEKEGVHVVYGLLGLKTHSKVALVVRKEGDTIRRYVHLATGNYNHVTAQLYTDMGLFTVDPDIGADASDLFNYLTGYSAKREYRKLIVAPINMRERMTALIRREMAHQKAGRPARLIFKMNSLVDKGMINVLYEASQAGVPIDLIVRGICCLRPGIRGVSESITVRSIVGRFLEHSRAFYFANGGEDEIYLGSADLMPRNIDRRVEVLFLLEDPRHIEQVKSVLELYLADDAQARILAADGAYARIAPGDSTTSAQAELIRNLDRTAPEASA